MERFGIQKGAPPARGLQGRMGTILVDRRSLGQFFTSVPPRVFGSRISSGSRFYGVDGKNRAVMKGQRFTREVA